MANYTQQGIKEYQEDQQNEFLLEDYQDEENWNYHEDLAMDEPANDNDGWGDDWFNDDDEPDYPSNPEFPSPVHIKYPKKFTLEKDLRLHSAMLRVQNAYEHITAHFAKEWRKCFVKEEHRLRQKEEELMQRYIFLDYDPLTHDKSFIHID